MLFTIVRSNRLNGFPEKLSKNSKVINMFKETSGVEKLLLEYYLFSHYEIPKIYFNEKLVNDNTDVFIVFDGHARPEFLRWLVSVNKGKRFILWCWNTVSEIENNLKLNDVPKDYEIWSYSEHDCNKYCLKYNSTFYWKSYSDNNCESTYYESDVYFIGKDKNRYKKIKILENRLTELGLKCNFQITPTHPWNIGFHYDRKIPYSKVIENINHTRAILDMTVSDTAGPTLRSIEASFYKKKLITDDMNVRKMRFYNSNNIFVLGPDCELDKLKEFLAVPYEDANTEDVAYYSVENWLHRFI